MGKLGYTWYPKDWTTSESVFELTLEQRGFYRELIDLAMLNDNTTVINSNVWCRKFDIHKDKLYDLFRDLNDLQLVLFSNDFEDGENLFIPSCEPRLNLSRGGKKGGEKSVKVKPTPKPIVKPIVKPTPNQRESKDKVNIIYNKSEFLKDWNELRLKHLKKPSFLNTLRGEDLDNFNDLLKDYKQEQFKESLIGLFKQKKLPNDSTSMQANPKHFLKFFNTYLTAYHDRNTNLYGKKDNDARTN